MTNCLSKILYFLSLVSSLTRYHHCHCHWPLLLLLTLLKPTRFTHSHEHHYTPPPVPSTLDPVKETTTQTNISNDCFLLATSLEAMATSITHKQQKHPKNPNWELSQNLEKWVLKRKFNHQFPNSQKHYR